MSDSSSQPSAVSTPMLVLSFALAILLPIAGIVLGVVFYARGDRRTGTAVIAVALIAILLFVFLLL